MNDVQVYDGQGVKPPGEVEPKKVDPLIFEKRIVSALETMAMDLKDIFAACRDPGSSGNSIMGVDQLMTRLKNLSSSHSYVYDTMIRKLKKDLGLDEYQTIHLPED